MDNSFLPRGRAEILDIGFKGVVRVFDHDVGVAATKQFLEQVLKIGSRFLECLHEQLAGGLIDLGDCGLKVIPRGRQVG